MAELTINGINYRTGKLSLFAQFHVARRLLPVIGAAESAITGAGRTEDGVINEGAVMLQLANAVAQLSDADCNFVIDACAAVTQREAQAGQGVGWAQVYAPTARRFMFDDMDLQVLLQIIIAVLRENIGGFLAAPAQVGQSQSTTGAPS